jgi:hypothetical protein
MVFSEPVAKGAGQAGIKVERRAGLGESVARIDEARKANMQRTGF